MKKIILLAFIASSLLIFACAKQEERVELPLEKNIFSKLRSELKERPIATIALSSIYLNGIDKSARSNISSWVSKESEANSLEINGISIPKKYSTNGSSIFSTELSNNTLTMRSDLNSLFGKDLNISLHLKQFGNVQGSLRAPIQIQSQVNDSDSVYELSRSNEIKITWNKDEYNRLPVLISIYKMPDLDDTTQVSGKLLTQINKEVSDQQGLIYIKSDDLKVFPVGSSVCIKVVRGDYRIAQTIGGEQVLYYVLTESSIPSILLKN